MWKDKLWEIIREKELYGEKVNTGATEEEIRLFLKAIKDELQTELPNEYVKFLKVINGIEFNGFILYGIDRRFLDAWQNQPINGFIEYNKIWYENEWHRQYVFLGESNICWYVYDLTECKYCELDNPSGRKSEVFDGLEHMVEKILSDALM